MTRAMGLTGRVLDHRAMSARAGYRSTGRSDLDHRAMSARAKSPARAPKACAWPAGSTRAQRVVETAGQIGRVK